MRITFETHATSLDNESGKASGWIDVDLSETGVRQAVELGERYIDKPPPVVYCSDLLRSYKTAVIAFEGTGVPIVVDGRLREWDYGQLSGADHKKVGRTKIKHIDTPFPDGESWRDAAKRMLDFLSDLEESIYSQIMIIGHRATQHGLEEHLKGRDIETLLDQEFIWQPGWKYQI